MMKRTEMKQIDMTGSRRLRWSSKSAEGVKDGWSIESRKDKSIWRD